MQFYGSCLYPFCAKGTINKTSTFFPRKYISITYQRDEEQGLKHVKDFYNILSYLRSFLETEYKVTPLQQKALQRRIHFLTIDYIQQLILNRRSLSFILSETKKLAVDKYIPLPANKYSWKYTIAQTIINLLTHL